MGMTSYPITSTVSPFATFRLWKVGLDIGLFELRISSSNSLPTYECMAPVSTHILYKLFSNFIIKWNLVSFNSSVSEFKYPGVLAMSFVTVVLSQIWAFPFEVSWLFTVKAV